MIGTHDGGLSPIKKSGCISCLPINRRSYMEMILKNSLHRFIIADPFLFYMVVANSMIDLSLEASGLGIQVELSQGRR